MRTLVHNLVGFARENVEHMMVVENSAPPPRPPETDDAMVDLFLYGIAGVPRHEKKR